MKLTGWTRSSGTLRRFGRGLEATLGELRQERAVAAERVAQLQREVGAGATPQSGASAIRWPT